ncbi:MAG TPA: hypothetical protein VM253_07345 [Candidatus Limnocylindrales bacterium]|nr:hypothetical protein [Candidatus Limnocylindrales bacterium]
MNRVALALVVTLALVGSACATDDETGETGVLTPAPTESPTPTEEGQVDDPAGTPPEGHIPDPDSCDGEIGAIEVEDVTVPDHASCTLEGTTVHGNIEVGSDASLEARSVSVDGDIQAEGALSVNVVDSTVEGNVQLEEGGRSKVSGTTIDGDLQWSGLEDTLEATDNTIDGNLQANDNTGGLTIRGNTIGGNLECEDNDPAPEGGDNEVDGDREGQCAEL